MTNVASDGSEATLAQIEERRNRITTLALLAAVATFVIVAILVGPSEDRPPVEWSRLGAFRAAWEYGKVVVPPGAALAVFAGVSLGMRYRDVRNTAGGALTK